MTKNRVLAAYKYRRILWEMAIAQFRAKYANSFFGIYWAVANPVLLMLVMAFIFTNVFKVEINNYHFFILAGIFPWMFFSSSLSEAVTVLLSKQSMLRQFNFPREIIPLASVSASFINFLFGWIFIYPAFLFLKPGIFFLFPVLLLGFILEFLFVAGLALIFSVLNVLYRDISHMLEILLVFWFWVTPIFYLVSMVPRKFHWIYNLNPMAYYVVFFREVIFNGALPNTQIFAGAAAWALAMFIAGLAIFLNLESRILKNI